MEPYIKIVEDKKQALEGYTIIMGFPGMGFVGTIAAKYLIDKIEMTKIAHFESNFVNPILLIHKGVILAPSRIYANKQKKIAVLISEQGMPKFLTQIMANEIINWCKKHKVKNLIAIEGIRSGMDKTSVFGLSSSKKTEELLKKHKIKKVEEGLTTGVSAFVLLKAKTEPKIEALSLLGDVHSLADYEAAAECLKKLSEILKIKIDTKPLLKEAENTKKMLLQQLEKIREEHKKASEPGDITPMYT